MQPSIPPDNVQPLTALERSSSLDTPPEPAQQTPFEPEDSDGGAESVRAAAAEQQTRRFLQATLDALTSHVAVIDAEGTILAVNKAWQRFAEANQGKAHACGVGANYFGVCQQSSGEWIQEATEIGRGIREVMTGCLLFSVRQYHRASAGRGGAAECKQCTGEGRNFSGSASARNGVSRLSANRSSETGGAQLICSPPCREHRIF